MTTYLILLAIAIAAVIIVSLCIAYISKRSEPYRYEDGAQSDRDVQLIRESMRGTL